jgi:predicted amidohydrolase YtcJ
MLVIKAEVAGQIRDVRLREGRIVEMGKRLFPEPGDNIFKARSGALIPGLHDHHLHLYALAAALASVNCGPPACASEARLQDSLRNATPDRGWIRGTGYFESVAGPLDRHRLDQIRSDVPVRIQHRSGVMWFLNSRAIKELSLDAIDTPSPPRDTFNPLDPQPIERDSNGRATGRLFRADRWLRDRLPQREAPDLAPVGQLLARYGVTAVTDATPTNTSEEFQLFHEAQVSGALPQQVRMMGGLSACSAPKQATPADAPSSVVVDAYKIMLDEPALPNLEALVKAIRTAHAQDRVVAIHTVTRAEIHFALAAFESAGVIPGDRLEHASISPPEAFETIRRLGLTVVTQPNFVSERGDHYRKEVEARDQPYLYRVQSWLDASIPLGGSTDAPFGDADPWKAMLAAVERRTPSNELLGAKERISPEMALGLFMDDFAQHTRAGRDSAPPVSIGDPADLCLLDRPWHEVRKGLSSERVAATFCRGELAYRAQRD